MNKQRRFYEAQAKEMVLALLKEKGMAYADLAAHLDEHGSRLSREVLTNKLHRGTYSFAFALQVLAALGETSISIPKLPAELGRAHRPEPSPPTEDSER
ncbi:DUF6471 domain-containing protein [Hydrogenophaga sp.]|uniref:DUF6471 domain-containing protein n=1 Tax=Hydrogenophaga sp. TaxID=1904254 RepID=UPI002630C46B|nr:DUF6471 domain-containing protein [Hydrogenophaga sp.]